MTQVFLSYDHDDQVFVDELEKALEAAGFDAWTDHDLEPGEDWKQRIDDAIKKSFALVVIMTPGAKQSEYVTYEWSFALGVGVTVISAILRETQLHPKLNDLQYLDFRTDKDGSLKKLLKTLPKLEQKYLLKELKNPQYIARAKAAKRLGELGTKAAVPDLIRMLEHDRSKRIVCPMVAEALEKIGTPEALAAVQKWRASH